MLPIRKVGAFCQGALKSFGDGIEGFCGRSGKQVTKHGRFRREGGIAAGQEVLIYLFDVCTYGATGADDLRFNAEIGANIPPEKTKAKIALGRSARVFLLFAFQRLVEERKGRKRINLMHDILDTGVECCGDLVLKMRIIFRYLEAVTQPQPIVPLPHIIEHHVYGIGAPTSRKFDKILRDGIVALERRIVVNQELSPHWPGQNHLAS